MKRIEKLRERALNHSVTMEEFQYRFHKSYSQNSHKNQYQRYADAFEEAFTNLTPCIWEDELIVGTYSDSFKDEEKDEWENIYRPIYIETAENAGSGQDSHMAIDYELILSVGLEGIIAKIDCYLKNCSEDQKDFYMACRSCLNTAIRYSDMYSECAQKLAENEKNLQRKNELAEISRICHKVPRKSAETFHEAVQCVHFITHMLSINPLRLTYQQFQLGHPDRYFLPYYERDIACKNISREYAQLLLDCLGIQINMRVPYGLSSGYMVGGRDRDGKPVENILTEMCMQVIEDIRLVYPAVGLCLCDDTDEKYLDKACTLLAKGYSHPAIFNDCIISKGLASYGVPKEDCHNYIHSTCVEITPTAASNVWVASPYTNMPGLLLDILSPEYGSFGEIMKALYKKIDEVIEYNFKDKTNARNHRKKHSINPLLSCFVNDCLSKGCDIEKGGAKYNWIMPSFVGMANLTDSLYAVKIGVFEKKILTLEKLCKALKNNFENQESLRLYLVNKIPKYGNDCSEIDNLFSEISEHIATECRKYGDGDIRLIPSVFCWEKHELFGRETGATPDGRKAGFPLGDGSGPCQGRELAGPTASILSSTKWDHSKFIGGVAVNMKFSKSSLGKNSVNTMKSLVKTYLKRGGFEIQINVTDKETLQKAMTNPEEYRDLIVRIGGYSNYFVRLSPNMQKEIILRTEHEI